MIKLLFYIFNLFFQLPSFIIISFRKIMTHTAFFEAVNAEINLY